jgi:hypothetical protein
MVRWVGSLDGAFLNDCPRGGCIGFSFTLSLKQRIGKILRGGPETLEVDMPMDRIA